MISISQLVIMWLFEISHSEAALKNPFSSKARNHKGAIYNDEQCMQKRPIMIISFVGIGQKSSIWKYEYDCDFELLHITDLL